MTAAVVEHRYTPRGSAVALLEHHAGEVLVAGPAGTGKSRACLEKLHLMCLLHPGIRGLIVRKTNVSLTSTALVTFREHVAKEALDNGTVWFYGGSKSEAAQYRYSNFSTITVGGMDIATKIMSSEYDTCFTGDTEVLATTPVQRGFARRYSGQLITITTAAGNKLTGTPNHPILTPHGWVGLGRLRKGDHVISRAPGQPLPAQADPDVAHQPVPIAEVVRALAEANGGRGATKRIETVPMDFHGDGGNGYVDVVTALGLLQDSSLATLLDPVTDPHGRRAEFEQAALVSFGPGTEGCLSSSMPPAPGGSLAELAHTFAVDLGPAPGLGGAGPGLGKVGLPLGVGAHPSLPVGERIGGRLPLDATGRHLSLEAGHADVNGQRYLKQPPLAGEVAPDRVVDISVTDASWSGHVYNLQTEASWYYASNIIAHNCYVQEAIELTEDDWEKITTRLRNGRLVLADGTVLQQLLADCNPDMPTHWLNVRCDQKLTARLESRHWENPRLYDEHTAADGARTYTLTEYGAGYMAKLEALTGVRRARLYLGQWVAAEGMIYADDWDAAVHLVDRFPIPDDWPRYWVVDFGYNHPFVCTPTGNS